MKAIQTVYFFDPEGAVIFSRNYGARKYYLTAAKEAKIFALQNGIKNVKWLKVDEKYIDFLSLNVSGLQIWHKEHNFLKQ